MALLFTWRHCRPTPRACPRPCSRAGVRGRRNLDAPVRLIWLGVAHQRTADGLPTLHRAPVPASPALSSETTDSIVIWPPRDADADCRQRLALLRRLNDALPLYFTPFCALLQTPVFRLLFLSSVNRSLQTSSCILKFLLVTLPREADL